MSDDGVIDIRDILKKKANEEGLSPDGAHIINMLVAALNQLRESMELNTEYIVNTLQEGDSITWIAVNNEDNTQSLRMSLSLTDLLEWIDE